jgi:phage major head subunit gpT-like protein
MHQGFLTRYTHAEFAGGFKITQIAMEDDQYGVLGEKGAQRLARGEKQTRETVAWLIFNRAFNSSFVGGDAKELLATDHPNAGGAGGTYANELAVAADISEAALEQSCIDIGKYLDDRGLKMAVKPQKIIVPIDLDFEVNKIMKTEYEVGTANNTVNIVRSRFPGGVMVSHWLTDTDAWFISTDVPHGLKFFERRAPKFETDNDWDTDNAKFKVSTRYSVGWTNPKALFGSPGA